MKRWFNLESMHTIAMIAVFGTMFLMCMASLGLLLYIEFSTAKLNLEVKAQALKKDAQVATPAQPSVAKEGACGSN